MTQIGWLASGWLVVDDTVLLSAPSMIFFYFSQSVAACWLHGWLAAAWLAACWRAWLAEPRGSQITGRYMHDVWA